MTEFTRRAVSRWMGANAIEHIDPRTGELNMTSLAEAAAEAFGQNEPGGPLDDETHFIWELAARLAS
jgi:hypothetical protein